MATPSIELLSALRNTAKKLATSNNYHWGHMGACNCGNLAQELLNVSKAEIHSWALATREGDWSEQTDEYCAISNLPMDLMISKLLSKGLTTQDLKHLEKLSDPFILNMLPEGERFLNFNQKNDVIKYLTLWADWMENTLADDVNIDSIYQNEDWLVYNP
jgi:hypothetical protein